MKSLMPKTRRFVVSSLFALTMPGCANSLAHTPAPDTGNVPGTPPVRVIVTFDHLPAANDQRPMRLIAEVCACTPVFVRQYLGHAVIYEITLPSNMSYPGFESTLLNRGAAIGVRAVEQDQRMQIQK